MAVAYTQFSQISVDDLVNYLRLCEVSESDRGLLASILEAARSYVLTYTGRNVEEADLIPEFTLAVMVLAEDLYDKRTYVVDSNLTNQIVDNILGSRSINLL